jgi:hypothetical protein
MSYVLGDDRPGKVIRVRGESAAAPSPIDRAIEALDRVCTVLEDSARERVLDRLLGAVEAGDLDRANAEELQKLVE